MKKMVLQVGMFQLSLMLIHYAQTCFSSPYVNGHGSDIKEANDYAFSPDLAPALSLQPLAPFQAPAPMMALTYSNVPKLSGQCAFNFSSAESILRITATDCWGSLAPYLGNVVCCPQFEASLVILMGQSSSDSGKLALNETHARYCISDVEQILESQGANENLHKICSISPNNLTGDSCPIIDVNKVDNILDTSKLLAACEKLDAANECCSQVCQNAVSAAAGKLALENHSFTATKGTPNGCKNIVLRWLASKLDPSSANRVLRGLSSCEVDRACPLVLLDIRKVSKECGNPKNNQTSCCEAMESYISNLQKQRFITSMQALNCAALLGLELQNGNVSTNVYNLCNIKLKDFSLQVDSRASGCLFPSLPSDVTFDIASGIGFVCDLNDNVAAPWPSGPFVPASFCNNTVILPDVPKATSAQRGLSISQLMLASFFAILLIQ